jgi:hypothetical protein
MVKTGQMQRIVVVGDMVASRKIADRAAVQKTLTACLKQLNAKRKGKILSPYTITLGDEFQAVFSRPEGLFRDAFRILRAIDPVKIRFSLGIGLIDTAINPIQAIGMDGPAFHAARAALDELKKTKSLFVVAGPPAGEIALVNQALALVSHQIRKWDKNQFDVFIGVAENQPVRLIAGQLGVSDKAIYKAVKSNAMKTIVRILDEITVRLAQRTVKS